MGGSSIDSVLFPIAGVESEVCFCFFLFFFFKCALIQLWTFWPDINLFMKAKCPVCASPLPKLNGNAKGWRWGGLFLKKQNSILRKHQLQRGTSTSPTSKKMEPGPYFKIKNALNGFTYNLVPEDH